MPVTSSEIIENSLQADDRRWIVEEHTASTGEKLSVRYLAAASADVNQIMTDRVARMNQKLFDMEISVYLNRIEKGLNVIGLDYYESTMAQRAERFIEWARERIREKDHKAIRYAYKVTENFTETQIDALLGAGMGAKVKAWEVKTKLVDEAMIDSEEEGKAI